MSRPLPHPLLIGVATSGYQSEGGYNGVGQPQNNWSHHENSGRVATTGAAVDFWNRYEEDFSLAQQIGINAFRLSVEWARVQPTHHAEAGKVPDWDLVAIDAYADRIAACRSHGMEPVVTWQHFTHPAWLGCDAWLQDETPALFEAFVAKVATQINERLTDHYNQEPIAWHVTLNEPNMLVLNTYLSRHFPGGKHAGVAVGVRAYNRLLAAHVRAYNALHDLYEARGWASPQVTMNTFCSDVYWSENLLLDLLCLRENGIAGKDIAAHVQARARALKAHLATSNLAYRRDFFSFFGRALHTIADFFASRAATQESFAYFLAEAERSKRVRVLDYLGLDYYDPFLSHIYRPPTFADLEFTTGSLHGHMMDGLSSKWWDWHVLPGGLHAFCKYYSQAFGGRGILIAENGMAQRCKRDNTTWVARRDRVKRGDFLLTHLREVCRLLDDGVPILGYLHWSLTDNYEWGSFTPRFGLFRVDYSDNMRRLAEDHYGDNPSRIYAQAIRDLNLLPPPSP